MLINLSQTPFSYRGSYMAFSYVERNFRGSTCEEGLYLRTVHNSTGNSAVARLLPLYQGEPIAFTYSATPDELTLMTEHGSIRICFADADTLLMMGMGEGLSLRLEGLSDGMGYNYVHPVVYGHQVSYLANCTKNDCRYMLYNQHGGLSVEQDWTVEHANTCHVVFSPAQGSFLAVVQEVAVHWQPRHYQYQYSQCHASVRDTFEVFYASMPKVPERYQPARELAAYVLWASTVKPFGFLRRDAMFMSKNWMTGVWSWDHCFNAMALAYGNPQAAWDQFMILFDHQDASGVIPDSINDSFVRRSFCKPPIHGWALEKMMKVMSLSIQQMEEAYQKLSKWTFWWLNFRDGDQDGVCEYYHGNDSGWDNATAFHMLPPVELPDLSAYLIIQMDVLSDLAARLGRFEEQKSWKRRADVMLEAMLAHSFEDGLPKALLSHSHQEVDNDSLILYLPIILGERLPAEVRARMIEVLRGDRFYTRFGFATESPASPRYTADGYWRGPIWAPSTMIIVDGLYRSGEKELAREAADRFAQMVQMSGFAENFDALTGAGLRDRAYTWTASAFLVMAQEFLAK